MPSSERTDWVALVKVCEDLGLPGPTLEPARIGNNSMATVGGFRAHGSVKQCLDACLDFCDGYKFRMSQEVKVSQSLEESRKISETYSAYACRLAGKVIENKGHLGPEDHVLLAKAIQALGEYHGL